MNKKTDIHALTEEIRDIFLDYRTTVRAEEVSDGSGKRYLDYELDCTREQEMEVARLIADAIIAECRRIFDAVMEKTG